MPRGVAERLEIPGADRAFRQGRVDQPSAALALAHLGVERGKIPAAGDLGPEIRDPAGMVRAGRQIVALARVARQIVELVRIGRASE